MADIRSRPFGLLLCVLAGVLVGWAQADIEPSPESAYRPGNALAVVSGLSFSGTESLLDPVRGADLFASELTQVPGLTVSRTIAARAHEGRRQVESFAHSLRVADRGGADGLVVIGITDYQPYSPIVVGLALQVNARNRPRFASGPEVTKTQTDGRTPRIQVQPVHKAAHDSPVSSLKKCVKRRDADESPYGWRRYMVS